MMHRKQAQPCPITAHLCSVEEWGKGEMWTYSLDMTLTNTMHTSRWLLLGKGLNTVFDERMDAWRVETSYFKNNPAVKYVSFFTSPGIIAFRLPGDGRLSLQNWSMDFVLPNAESLYVWQAKSIEIDGSQTTLSNWLPIDFTCPVLSTVNNAKEAVLTHFHDVGPGEGGHVQFTGIDEKWLVQLIGADSQ